MNDPEPELTEENNMHTHTHSLFPAAPAWGKVEAVAAQSGTAERNTMPVKGGMGNDTYESRWQVKGRDE
jgi:hypothetical protein